MRFMQTESVLQTKNRSGPAINRFSVALPHGSLVVSALAFTARGHGFDPHGRRGKILVSEHAFLSVICRDDTK